MTRAMTWAHLLCALLLVLPTTGRPQASNTIAVRETDRRSPGYKAYQQANTLFVAKKFPESWSAIEEALRLDSRLVPALTLKAKLAMSMNRFDVARDSLEAALAADPTSSYAQFLYGFQFYLANDLSLAFPALTKARQLNPTDPRAALYLGLTQESLGHPEDALSLYREAERLERAAGSPQAETFLTGARLLLLLGNLDECEQSIQSALRADPNLRDAHYEYARLLLKKGLAAKAAEEGEAALKMHNGAVADSNIHYLLVRAYGTDHPEDAARHAEALRAAP
jgi:tetratricopeptide (TPR) repeat protein